MLQLMRLQRVRHELMTLQQSTLEFILSSSFAIMKQVNIDHVFNVQIKQYGIV